MFDYIYSDQSRRFNFIRLPQVLFTDERFRTLSSDAKILYSLMLDRTGLSIKRHWLDTEGRVYINFPRAEVTEKLGIGMQKAGKLMQELERFGLIERVRIGLGNPDRIYVKHCTRQSEAVDDETEMPIVETVECVDNEVVETVTEDGFSSFQNAENHHSGEVNFTVQEVSKSSFPPLYNQTEIVRLKQSDHIYPDSGRKDENDFAAKRDAYEQVIKENIEYEWFTEVFKLPLKNPNRPYGSMEELDNIVSIMLDCVCTNAEKMRVNGSEQYTSVIRSRFLKLNNEHIQYVLQCLNKCDSEVKNIRAYLITVLYNAPTTMETAFGLDFRATYWHREV